MGGTKRMSTEEKRKKVLSIYHQTKQVYTEKEIVTLATKAGVNTNTIVDINTSLIDDGLVEKEKIGGSNYFWSFPSKQDHMMKMEHKQTIEEIEHLKLRQEEQMVQLADAKRGREEDENGTRAKKLARLAEIDTLKAEATKELESLKENDPQFIANLEKEYKFISDAANRWTDNIFNCKAYLTKKRGMDKKEANRILGITSAFDYPEEK